MLPLVYLPDDRLFKKSTEVANIDDRVRDLAAQMVETMHEADGVGLAGVQVGSMDRIFVTHAMDDGPRVFINPRILSFSDETGPYEEGCLSIPGVYSDVIRPLEVTIVAVDVDGKEFRVDATGQLARVVQHELDHLDGVLFYHHLKPRQQERFLKIYARTRGIREKELFAAVDAADPHRTQNGA